MADPTFADLVEQARQRLVTSVSAVELRDEWNDWREPAWQQYITEAVAQMSTLRREGLPEDLVLTLPGSVEILDADGEECWASLTETSSPDMLNRIAARAVVAYALLRQQAEEQMMVALVALDRVKPVEERRYRVGADGEGR